MTRIKRSFTPEDRLSIVQEGEREEGERDRSH